MTRLQGQSQVLEENKKLLQSEKPYPNRERDCWHPFRPCLLLCGISPARLHTSADYAHQTTNMSSTMTVAQQLLLRLRNKRHKRSFCGLEACLGWGQAHIQVRNGKYTIVLIRQPEVGAHRLLPCQLAGGDLSDQPCGQPCMFLLQEDNTPQEQVFMASTAPQAITGGFSLSQGFWAFCGVSRLAQSAPHAWGATHVLYSTPSLCWFGCTRLDLQPTSYSRLPTWQPVCTCPAYTPGLHPARHLTLTGPCPAIAL